MNGTANILSKIYYNGDKVTYTCENGYHLKGSDEITCRNGKWTPPPECIGKYSVSGKEQNKREIPFWNVSSMRAETTNTYTIAYKTHKYI